jgi:hypothetical protein
VIQQGQVFNLKARCADGEPLWAYRYRVAGRGSARLQVGGFSTKAEAQRALCSGRRPPNWVKCVLLSSRRSGSVRGGLLFRKGTASKRRRRCGRC